MTMPSDAMNQISFPEMYERWLVGPLFRPWAEMLVEEMKPAPRDRVLDVGCGTGIVARLAKERLGTGGHVVGVDVNPDMLAVARAVAPEIDWRQGNATALPLGDGEHFDLVLCQQALQFVPDKPAAAAQFRQALAKGGRLGVATWRADDEAPFLRELRRVAERHLGPILDRRHSFGDAAALEALLREADLREVQSRKFARTVRFDGNTPFVRLNAMALVGMSGAGKGMADDELKRVVDAIVSDSAPILLSYSDESGCLAFELSTNFATATG